MVGLGYGVFGRVFCVEEGAVLIWRVVRGIF